MNQNQPRLLAAANAIWAFQPVTLTATGNHDGEKLMTAPQSRRTTEPSLGRDVLNATRYYLGNRWALLVLGSAAVIAGLSFGGWAWFVGAGLAPVILSTLPCLVMCGLGVCIACRSGKTQSTASLDAADSATSSTALSVAKGEQPIAGGSNCHRETGESPSLQVKQFQALDERMDSHP